MAITLFQCDKEALRRVLHILENVLPIQHESSLFPLGIGIATTTPSGSGRWRLVKGWIENLRSFLALYTCGTGRTYWHPGLRQRLIALEHY